jgi:hypothetical protein
VVSEDEFTDTISENLNSHPLVSHVEQEYHIEQLDRFLDLLVTVGTVRLAVEVENTPEDALYNGVGQALLYARETNTIPLVVYPETEDTTTSRELRHQQSQCPIVSIPPDWSGDVTDIVSSGRWETTDV